MVIQCGLLASWSMRQAWKASSAWIPNTFSDLLS